MKLFIFIFLKFIFIYNCVCWYDLRDLEDHCINVSEASNDDHNHYAEVILLGNKLTIDRNYMFLNYINDVIGNVILTNEICPGGVVGTITALELYQNAEIVNLDVQDFYYYNYNYILNRGLNYAGDIGDSIKNFSSYVIDTNDTDQYSEDMKIKNLTLRSVKLFSNRGIVHESVYDYIYNFERDSELTTYSNKPRIVLLCFDSYKRNNEHIIHLFKLERLRRVFTSNCKTAIIKMKQHILAVITPERFEMDEDLLQMPFPIVLCSNPFTQLLPSPYKNFTTLTSSNPNRIFKLALIQFMKKVVWQRIGILSDNYDYSMEFERSLVSIFDEESVMYTVFRCEENLQGNYNFLEVLKTLENVDARIIILNVDEKNLKKISEQIQHHSYLYNNCVWILRDGLSGTDTQNIGAVISIYVTPVNSNDYISVRVDSLEENVVNKIKIKSITESASRVQRAYDVTSRFFSDHRNIYEYDNSSNAFMKFNHALGKTSDNQVNIVYQFRNNDPQVLATLIFDDFGIRNEKYTLSVYIQPDMHECVIRSRNFFKPCNYFELIYLMFVLVIFFPTFFTVIIFFSDKNIIYGRRNYRNL